MTRTHGKSRCRHWQLPMATPCYLRRTRRALHISRASACLARSVLNHEDDKEDWHRPEYEAKTCVLLAILSILSIQAVLRTLGNRLPGMQGWTLAATHAAMMRVGPQSRRSTIRSALWPAQLQGRLSSLMGNALSRAMHASIFRARPSPPHVRRHMRKP